MIKKSLLLIFIFSHCIVTAQRADIHLISWNIRDFGKTKNSVELNQIADLIKETDILVVQEVVAGYGGAQAVARLANNLNRRGSSWDYVISDPTNSSKYVTERYAVLWKNKHIKIKNRGSLIKALDTAIDREPFLIDFYVKGKKLTVINFHSRPYDKNPEAEIKALINYITTTIKTPLILAGDFNVTESKPVFDTLKTNDYTAAVSNLKTTLKKTCDDFEYRNHAIDNIFYSKAILKTTSGVLDFVKACDNLEHARKLSDHLPVYLRFQL